MTYHEHHKAIGKSYVPDCPDCQKEDRLAARELRSEELRLARAERKRVYEKKRYKKRIRETEGRDPRDNGLRGLRRLKRRRGYASTDEG